MLEKYVKMAKCKVMNSMCFFGMDDIEIIQRFVSGTSD